MKTVFRIFVILAVMLIFTACPSGNRGVKSANMDNDSILVEKVCVDSLNFEGKDVVVDSLKVE